MPHKMGQDQDRKALGIVVEIMAAFTNPAKCEALSTHVFQSLLLGVDACRLGFLHGGGQEGTHARL